MTNEEFDERKLYLKQTIKAKDVLFRYGIRVDSRNRCRGFCHNGKSQDTLKVFDDGVQCFAGCGSMDIFQIVIFFEHCDFPTALKILGGDEEFDENTKRKMAAECEKEKNRIERERKRKEKIKHICKVIDLYQTLELQHEPLSDEWCYCKNKLCYWIYLLDYYLELKIK